MILRSVYIYKKMITQARLTMGSQIHASQPKQAVVIISFSMNWMPLPPVVAVDGMFSSAEEIIQEGKLYDLETDDAGTLSGFKQLYR